MISIPGHPKVGDFAGHLEGVFQFLQQFIVGVRRLQPIRYRATVWDGIVGQIMAMT